MSRNLDTSLAAALPNTSIMPVVFAALTFQSGVVYVWTGVGDFVFNGNTYEGVGSLGKISSISEGVDVNAAGISVTLSGIGTEAVAPSSPPAGISPPVTVPAGQYVAWSYPSAVAGYSDAPHGTVDAQLTESTMVRYSAGGDVFNGTHTVWSAFNTPTLPADAVIVGLYATAFVSGTPGGAFTNNSFGAPNTPPSSSFSGQYHQIVGTTLVGLDAVTLNAGMAASLEQPDFDQTLQVNNPCIAVYYTSASDAYSITNDAMLDYQLGGPAQVWFGLLDNGELIGTPYLIFSGQMDQPEVSIDTTTASITIALENRLVNLGRPTARRYTSADQHLSYPDDIALNWVEILNDIALSWGTS